MHQIPAAAEMHCTSSAAGRKAGKGCTSTHPSSCPTVLACEKDWQPASGLTTQLSRRL